MLCNLPFFLIPQFTFTHLANTVVQSDFAFEAYVLPGILGNRSHDLKVASAEL